jgi:flagellar basal body-associated protein FliL
MLKIIIILLMIALVASLATGLVFLMSDQGSSNKRRLFHSLGVRL